MGWELKLALGYMYSKWVGVPNYVYDLPQIFCFDVHVH